MKFHGEVEIEQDAVEVLACVRVIQGLNIESIEDKYLADLLKQDRDGSEVLAVHTLERGVSPYKLTSLTASPVILIRPLSRSLMRRF